VRKAAGIGYKNLGANSTPMAINPEEFQNPYYKRHDVLGYNYRMPELCAAIGLAQYERIEEIVSRRKSIGKLFKKAVHGCDWLIHQKIPEGYISSYYAFAILYKGDEKYDITWQDFRKMYIEMGGDGIYGAHSLPYEEPVLAELVIRGDCPVAEELQPKMMLFKTNYRDLSLAENKSNILRELMLKIEK